MDRRNFIVGAFATGISLVQGLFKVKAERPAQESRGLPGNQHRQKGQLPEAPDADYTLQIGDLVTIVFGHPMWEYPNGLIDIRPDLVGLEARVIDVDKNGDGDLLIYYPGREPSRSCWYSPWQLQRRPPGWVKTYKLVGTKGDYKMWETGANA